MNIKKRNKGKVLILYYSGVGGTRVVSEVLADSLGLSFFEDTSLEVLSIDSDYIVNMSDLELQIYLSEFDVLVFGCPVYRMMPPKPMMEFIARIRRFDAPMKAYTFMTKSGISGDATLALIEMLEEKNIIVCGHAEIIAPGTDMNLVVKKKKSKDPDFGLFRNFAASIWDALFCGGRGARQLIKEMAKDIFVIMFYSPVEIRKPKPKRFMGIMWWIQVKYLDKTEAAMHEIEFREPCDKCGDKCVAWKCPRSAWTEEDGNPEFVWKNCIACQMCVNMCPRSVIISAQQVISGTEDFPRLNKKFYREAKEIFFK